MLIVYDSLTRNVERFIKKIKEDGHEYKKISPSLEVHEPFLLITYTTGKGQVPPSTEKFLHQFGHLMEAVISSGNRNWGANYGKAGDKISSEYHVPLMMKFELSGLPSDVEKAKHIVSEMGLELGVTTCQNV